MLNMLHRPASVGAVVKKIMEINPELGVQDVIALVRQATTRKQEDEYSSMEIVDERLALELARRTLERSEQPRQRQS